MCTDKMQLLRTQMLIVSYLLSNSPIEQVVHMHAHAHTQPHCTDICITVFIADKYLSLHEHRQNVLIHT